jgi:hypothetical protein
MAESLGGRMGKEGTGKSHPHRVKRRTQAAAIVLAVMAASATYGFLVHSHHVFPYVLLKRSFTRFQPHAHRMHRRHVKPGDDDLTSPDAIQHLANLPYLQGYRPATAGGIIRVHDQVLSEDGLNFFTSGHAPVATLMDMNGTVVKTWAADPVKSFPAAVLEKHKAHEYFLRDAELLPDGGIVAMFDEIGLVRLDAASRVVWVWPASVHHDLFVDSTGEIWALAREKRVVPGLHNGDPILEDFVVELSPEGKVVRRISLVECFQRSRYAPLLASAPREKENLFHTNSVAVFDGSLAGRSPVFRRGNLLISLKNLNVVAVVDPDASRVVWALTGQWYGQHCARLLSTGHILLFDNLGAMRKASRVLEVDPSSQEVLWSYGARPGEDLLSETIGSVERLPGGNTLITETNHGRVLEVTPDNQIVWEFVNPNRIGKKKELVAVVYFMQRVKRNLPFLARPVAGSPSEPRVSETY